MNINIKNIIGLIGLVFLLFEGRTILHRAIHMNPFRGLSSFEASIDPGHLLTLGALIVGILLALRYVRRE